MQVLTSENNTQQAQEKLANAISRLERAIEKLSAKKEIRNKAISELDTCIEKLEDILTSPGE